MLLLYLLGSKCMLLSYDLMATACYRCKSALVSSINVWPCMQNV